MNMTLAPDKILLWIDCETTGLPTDLRPPTVLELAWTLTDGVGEQLTPLRRVFTRLVLPRGRRTRAVGQPVVPRLHADSSTSWPTEAEDYPGMTVIDMHRLSGLALEWATVARDRPWEIVEAGGHLDGLLLTDLATVVDLTGDPVVHLAGAGVSHMEDRILPALCPRTARWLHYAAIDVSGELRARELRSRGRLPGKVSDQIALGQQAIRRGDIADQWMHVRFDRAGVTAVDPDAEADIEWALGTETPHRAAPDVARSLMAYRLLGELDALPYWVAPEPAEAAR